MSFLQNSRSKFSFAECAFESGNPTPVNKKLASGYIWLKNSINGMLPPQPTNRGSFPLNTCLFAEKKASFILGSKSPESKPFPQNLGSNEISAWYECCSSLTNFSRISVAYSPLSVGGSLNEHLRVTCPLIEFEASLSFAGIPSTAVIVN